MGGGTWRLRSRLGRAILALGGIFAFVAVAILLEDDMGLPFDTTYRVACAAACLALIVKLARDYPGERWPRISLGFALLVNVAIFFTPLVDRPTSRGELMIFALPDAIVVLVARLVSYRVVDVDQRAMRMHIIFGLVVAVVFCSTLFALVLMGSHTGR